MEYLDAMSIPASKSELNLFSIPPTQVAIESTYESDYRPTASLESGETYELHIPSSEDFTDLSATMIHVKLQIIDENGAVVNNDDEVKTVCNFGNSLFQQIDMYLGSTNTSLANNMYHYQAYLEDLLYRYTSKVDHGFMVDEKIVEKDRLYDLYFRLHLPMCMQDKLLLNGVPIMFRFTKSSPTFPLIKISQTPLKKYHVKITNFSLHLKKIKLFPDAQASIITTLETHPAKYFITRADTKSFSITKGINNVTIENVFAGILPRRVIIGFVKEESLSGDLSTNPYEFKHFDISNICINIDGVIYPSIPYTPDFDKNNAIREFVNLYRVLGQDEGIPQLNLSYDEYIKHTCLFAFDIGGDLGAEKGVLSLLKRGKIRLEINFKKTLTSAIKAVIFGQFDNLITIDKDRQVTIDY